MAHLYLPTILVFRGQYCKSWDIVSDHVSVSFSSYEVAKKYALNPNNRNRFKMESKIFEAELTISKPFIESEDCFLELTEVIEKLGIEEAKRISVKFSQYIELTDNWNENFKQDYFRVSELVRLHPEKMKELYFLAWSFFDDDEEVQKLKDLGYDGCSYIGSGVGREEREYRVFDLKQVNILDTKLVE